MGDKTSRKMKVPGAAFAGGFVLIAGGALGLGASQHVPTVQPGTDLAGKDISGFTREEAVDALNKWFESAKSKELKLTSPYLEVQPNDVTPGSLGAKLDLEKSLQNLVLEDFWSHYSRRITGQAPSKVKIGPVLVFDEKKIEGLGDFIEENMKAGAPARADWNGSKVVRTYEVPGMALDLPKLSEAVYQASFTDDEVEIPMVLAPKKVPDEDLDKITEVVASYKTNFNNGQVDRSTNIRLAAEIIDGRVLMPGETFSFNRFVGRRTAKGGFRSAGVFVNGRKEYDIGGGICQVSTTLYNAAVYADLKIKARSNHSRPVPYVPLGRDAAVSYPEPDFVFENNHDIPIALSATVGRGTIEFRILGQKEPGKEIRITQGGVSTTANGVKYVQDDTLGYGVQRVIESGSSRRSVNSYKITMKDGKEVKRETLATSFYRGSPRIIARNGKAAPPAAKPAEPTAAATVTAGSGSSSSPVSPSPQGE